MTRWLLTGALIVLTGCDSEPGDETLAVFAASSLTDAFADLERAFEDTHPGVEVRTSFAGSQVLRLQIAEGAPADIFASADEDHLDALTASGHVGPSEVFARNELVLIVPTDNPAGLERFEDLTRAERLVVGDPSVPVGEYTRALLARADPGFASAVRARVVSEEPNVRLVRAKVELGEADAAIVYRTDALGSDRVRLIEIPDAANVRASYAIGVVEGAERADIAARWQAFVLGDDGQRILRTRGFLPP